MESQGIYLGFMPDIFSLPTINPQAISHSQVITIIRRQTFENNRGVLVYTFFVLRDIIIIAMYRRFLGIFD